MGLYWIWSVRNSVRFFCVTVFSGTIIAGILKLGMHMDNESLYCGIENQTPCSYSSIYLIILLSFMAIFVSQFSPELCKLKSSNMVYLCRMSDCIVGLRHRVMAFIFLFFIFFLSFPKLQPGRVAQSVGHLTRKSGVPGSIPGLATYFRFSFRFFKKGSCLLVAKVCARSTS